MPIAFQGLQIIEMIVPHAPLGKRWAITFDGRVMCDTPSPESAVRNYKYEAEYIQAGKSGSKYSPTIEKAFGGRQMRDVTAELIGETETVVA